MRVQTAPFDSADIFFGEVVQQVAPPIRWLVSSVCLHALIIASLGLISAVSQPERKPTRVDSNNPTVVRIAGHIYYVSELPSQTRPVTVKLVPRPSPVTPAPKPSEAETALPPKAPVTVARAFLPPELPKNTVSDITLLQPLPAPAVLTVDPQLPSVVIATAQPKLPRAVKPFVQPGRQAQKVPDPLQPLPQPNVDVTPANPTAVNLNPALVLSPAFPSVAPAPPPKAAVTTPPITAGDPIDLISLNNKSVPPTEQLVVPPASVIGRTAEGGASPGKPNATKPGADKDAGGTASISVSGSVGGGVTVVGGNGPAPRPTGPNVMERSPTGTFDAIIIQSNPLDQFPESKAFLTGRPIYTVYVTAGTAKDWPLYFCIPGERTSASNSRVVTLDAPAPVQAPYPTRLVRPEVSVPSYVKYILVHGVVTAAGRVEKLGIVRSVRYDTDRIVMASLAGWEFRPATRDGVNTAVEFLLAIPVTGL